jgi:hypothetical protein
MLLPLRASFTPLRYPVPYPISHAATEQPAMKSQVSPLGRVHSQCITAMIAKSPVRDAASPVAIPPSCRASGHGASPSRILDGAARLTVRS